MIPRGAVSRWCPSSLAKLVNITPISLWFMADITILKMGFINQQTSLGGTKYLQSLLAWFLGKKYNYVLSSWSHRRFQPCFFDCAVYDTSGITCTHEHLNMSSFHCESLNSPAEQLRDVGHKTPHCGRRNSVCTISWPILPPTAVGTSSAETGAHKRHWSLEYLEDHPT